MKWHDLKIQTQYFNAIQIGTKTFEIRENDRDFQVGDVLYLREFDLLEGYTDRVLKRRISYITDYAQQENYVVMSIIKEN